jgi:hypothetical protein
VTTSAPSIGFADGGVKGLLFAALGFAVLAVVMSGALTRGGGRSSSAAEWAPASTPVHQQAPQQQVQPATVQPAAAPRPVTPVSTGGIPAQAPPDLDAPLHPDGGIPGRAPEPTPINDGGIPAPAPSDLDEPISRDGGIPAPPPTR